MRTRPVLDIRAGCKRIPDGRLLFEELDLSVEAGSTIGVVGESGAGKSTLLSCLGLLDRFDYGQYVLDGRNVTTMKQSSLDRVRGKSVGFVFQRFFLDSGLSAIENVQAAFRHGGVRFGQAERKASRAILDALGLATKMKLKPRMLSGGEQQRVAIARALVREPRLVLADEPTGALDRDLGLSVVAHLTSFARRTGGALILVTHDGEIAAQMDRVLHISGGRLQESRR